MPDTPLPRLSRLSRNFSGSLNRRSQAQLARDLVRLVRFLRTFLQRDQKPGEHLKEDAALPMSPKGQKGSNFIEFYKNRKFSGQTRLSLREKEVCYKPKASWEFRLLCVGAEYLETDESQGHRLLVTSSAVAPAVGLKE